MNTNIIMVGFIGLSCSIAAPLHAKILSPSQYADTVLSKQTNEELKEEYLQRKQNLTAPPRTFPEDIEEDVTWTDQPEYKMEMFHEVMQEITWRLSQTKTPQERTQLTDFFYGNAPQKKKSCCNEHANH